MYYLLYNNGNKSATKVRHSIWIYIVRKSFEICINIVVDVSIAYAEKKGRKKKKEKKRKRKKKNNYKERRSFHYPKIPSSEELRLPINSDSRGYIVRTNKVRETRSFLIVNPPRVKPRVTRVSIEEKEKRPVGRV